MQIFRFNGFFDRILRFREQGQYICKYKYVKFNFSESVKLYLSQFESEKFNKKCDYLVVPDPATSENLPAIQSADYLNLESESLVSNPDIFNSIIDFEDVTDLRHGMARNRSLVLDGLDIGIG